MNIASILGQAMVEYLVVTGALVMALGISLADDDSVLWQLASAFQEAYRRFSFAISIPT